MKRIVKRANKKGKQLTKGREDLINIQEATDEKQSDTNRIQRQIRRMLSLQKRNFGIEVTKQSLLSWYCCSLLKPYLLQYKMTDQDDTPNKTKEETD